MSKDGKGASVGDLTEEERRRKSEAEIKLEEQIILRVPNDLANELRGLINKSGEKGGEAKNKGKDQKIAFLLQDKDRNYGRARFLCSGQKYDATLVNIPTLLETYKTYNNNLYYKSGDVGQMLVVHDSEKKKMRMDDNGFIESGVLPPFKGIKRKWRKPFRDRTEVAEAEAELLNWRGDPNALVSVEVVEPVTEPLSEAIAVTPEPQSTPKQREEPTSERPVKRTRIEEPKDKESTSASTSSLLSVPTAASVGTSPNIPSPVTISPAHSNLSIPVHINTSTNTGAHSTVNSNVEPVKDGSAMNLDGPSNSGSTIPTVSTYSAIPTVGGNNLFSNPPTVSNITSTSNAMLSPHSTPSLENIRTSDNTINSSSSSINSQPQTPVPVVIVPVAAPVVDPQVVEWEKELNLMLEQAEKLQRTVTSLATQQQNATNPMVRSRLTAQHTNANNQLQKVNSRAEELRTLIQAKRNM
eukprot:TRINITY_DN4204_c0_g1_i2.p1 TRINITY_DN4204_c0_g1~~TRINITY_DN4204_c0_g1_i2.p1  ORF type:complete len:469 (-),score=104.75 TRINITY_DN4204_c0_g1_i2:57-1463(-)